MTHELIEQQDPAGATRDLVRRELQSRGIDTLRATFAKNRRNLVHVHGRLEYSVVYERNGEVVSDISSDLHVEVRTFLKQQTRQMVVEDAEGQGSLIWDIAADAVSLDYLGSLEVPVGVPRSMPGASSTGLRERRVDAAMLAIAAIMGDAAPKSDKQLGYLRQHVDFAMERTANDRESFLTEAQRDLLLDVICFTRKDKDGSDAAAFIDEVVTFGYWGYEHATDIELIEKVACECTLNDLRAAAESESYSVSESYVPDERYAGMVEAMTTGRGLEVLEANSDGPFYLAWRQDVANNVSAPKG